MADLNDVVRQLVADEVERALAPYQGTLSRLSAAFGGMVPAAGGRRSSGRAAAAPAATRGPGRRAGGRRAAGGASKAGDASAFSEGMKVKYKQGRGEFEATVSRVDTESNVLSLTRSTDGKKVERPAAKVYPA